MNATSKTYQTDQGDIEIGGTYVDDTEGVTVEVHAVSGVDVYYKGDIEGCSHFEEFSAVFRAGQLKEFLRRGSAADLCRNALDGLPVSFRSKRAHLRRHHYPEV